MNFKRNKYGNKKIVSHGIKFDSKRELYMYDSLMYAGISFDFQVKYIIMRGFRNNKGKKIRDIYMVVDFVVNSNGVKYIIDVKGMFLDVAKIKYKMLEKELHDLEFKYEMLFPSNKLQVDDIVQELKRRKDGDSILLQV